MIAERLESAKIVFGLKSELAGAIDNLSARSHIPDLGAQFRVHKPDQQNERYSYIGDGIAVPRLRIDNLAEPELILGLSQRQVLGKFSQESGKDDGRWRAAAAERFA